MCSGMSDIVGRLEAMAAEIKSLRALLGRCEPTMARLSKPFEDERSWGPQLRRASCEVLLGDIRAALAKGEG